MSVYIPRHFTIKELVPDWMYESVHPKVLWGMFDPDLLKALDWIKVTFSPNDPVIVNDKYLGKTFNYSGLRTKDSSDYSEGSMHSIGKGADLKFSNITPEEIRQKIKAMIKRGEYVPYIGRIEEGTKTWLHIDTLRIKPEGYVYFFNP